MCNGFHAEFEGSENYSQSNRWRREMEAKLQEEENSQILMELRNRKMSNGGYAAPNGVIGNGRVTQFHSVNGQNGNFYDRENGHGGKTVSIGEQQYERRSDVCNEYPIL